MSEFTAHDDARRSRILEAALDEFAARGYKKASTNTIVREAKVSKGLLFHYFISKKDLYIYLVKSAIDTSLKEMFDGVNFADRDVLNRMHKAAVVKINSTLTHTSFTRLLEGLKNVEDETIVHELLAYQQKAVEEGYEKLFSNIDYYLFKDNLNVDRCLNVVKWTIGHLEKDWSKLQKDPTKKESYDELMMFLDHYLGLFRDAFYR